jgi:lysophospholipase L1-like esterase
MIRCQQGHTMGGARRYTSLIMVTLATAGPVIVIAGDSGPVGAAKAVKVVLVGDSTVADGSGWGPGFARRLGPGAACLNMARSGRSSKSYADEGHWKKALALQPDYVLIQFGHNDQPGKGPERETDPETSFRQNMGRYIDEARAAGARPIVVTSVTRRNFTSQGKVRADGLVPYVEAARRTAKEKGVPLVDLYARSVEAIERIGPNAAEAYDAASPDPQKRDRTHLSPPGADAMVDLVVQELKGVEPSLASHFR